MWLLGGFVFGFALSDVLHLVGLGWATWPVMAGLTIYALAGFTVARRRQGR